MVQIRIESSRQVDRIAGIRSKSQLKYDWNPIQNEIWLEVYEMALAYCARVNLT